MTATASLATTEALQDGHIAHVIDADGHSVILIGTRPLTDAQAEGRAIVREGLAEILAWLGEDTELPTGRTTADHLRGKLPELPVSTLAIRPAEYRLHYLSATGTLTRNGDHLTGGTSEPMALDARTAATMHPLPPLEYLSRPGALHRAITEAVEDAYRRLTHLLTTDGYVADVTDGYPVPELRVELRVKAWPAVPGITAPEGEPSRIGAWAAP